jgi:hypothetical protein
VTLFFSIATLFLTVAVVIIAALQWRVANNKLRLDLFDRRYKVYDATRKFLAAICREGKFTDSERFEFEVGTSDAEFFFGADVVNHLAKIRKQALHLRTTQQLLQQPNTSDEELSRYADAQEQDFLWLGDQLTEITKTFTAYLGFANVRLRFWASLNPFSANR